MIKLVMKKFIIAIVLQVRTLIQKSFKTALDENDILISPAAPSAAYKIGKEVVFVSLIWKLYLLLLLLCISVLLIY